METKEEFFQFEKEKQKVFNNFYKSNNIPYKRIYGKENKKYDCVILLNNYWIKVEEKFRSKEYPDLLVETIQDINTNSPGWLYYTEADLLLYGVEQKIYQIDVSKLREFIKFHGNEFSKIISKKGWGTTENIIIPWSVIFVNNIGKKIR